MNAGVSVPKATQPPIHHAQRCPRDAMAANWENAYLKYVVHQPSKLKLTSCMKAHTAHESYTGGRPQYLATLGRTCPYRAVFSFVVLSRRFDARLRGLTFQTICVPRDHFAPVHDF